MPESCDNKGLWETHLQRKLQKKHLLELIYKEKFGDLHTNLCGSFHSRKDHKQKNDYSTAPQN